MEIASSEDVRFAEITRCCAGLEGLHETTDVHRLHVNGQLYESAQVLRVSIAIDQHGY